MAVCVQCKACGITNSGAVDGNRTIDEVFRIASDQAEKNGSSRALMELVGLYYERLVFGVTDSSKPERFSPRSNISDIKKIMELSEAAFNIECDRVDHDGE